MIVHVPLCVRRAQSVEHRAGVRLEGAAVRNGTELVFPDAVAYPALINSHDHLVGNWYPRSGTHRPYINSHIWVEDMKQSASYLERNRYWVNDGSFRQNEGRALQVAALGVYKNVFSGVGVVQDHAPNQVPGFYTRWPIQVLQEYRQAHSVTLNNWWGGGELEEEMDASQGKMPFIIHLGEGTDEVTRGEFDQLVRRGLLRPNTLIIHGISLTEDELAQCAAAGASICWCPASNDYLLEQALNVSAALRLGVNLVLGTDSTQTGSINMFSELRAAHQFMPHIPPQQLFGMVTANAARALHLSSGEGELGETNRHLLVTRRYHQDAFANLLNVDKEDILLFVYNGRPVYGLAHYLTYFDVDPADFDLFHLRGEERFVAGHPMAVVAEIDSVLGYHKAFPYLPF